MKNQAENYATPEEAVSRFLSTPCNNFLYCQSLVCEFTKKHIEEFNNVPTLSMIYLFMYEAGVMQGKREERERRKAEKVN